MFKFRFYLFIIIINNVELFIGAKWDGFTPWYSDSCKFSHRQ